MTVPSDGGEKKTAQWRKWISWGVVAVVAIVASQLPFERVSDDLRAWIEGLGVWGPIALAGIYILATVLFVPGVLLTLIAGAVFGLWVGVVTVSVGSTVGAAFAFLIARYAARERVARMAESYQKFGAIDEAISEGGWRVVALLRLSPLVPFNVQNYLYGLTRIRFWPYAVTSWICMLPGTFLYVYIGHVTGAAVGGQRERGVWEWVALGVGLLATVLVTWYVGRLSRRKLAELREE